VRVKKFKRDGNPDRKIASRRDGKGCGKQTAVLFYFSGAVTIQNLKGKILSTFLCGVRLRASEDQKGSRPICGIQALKRP
jgi:hypothetical protein